MVLGVSVAAHPVRLLPIMAPSRRSRPNATQLIGEPQDQKGNRIGHSRRNTAPDAPATTTGNGGALGAAGQEPGGRHANSADRWWFLSSDALHSGGCGIFERLAAVTIHRTRYRDPNAHHWVSACAKAHTAHKMPRARAKEKRFAPRKVEIAIERLGRASPSSSAATRAWALKTCVALRFANPKRGGCNGWLWERQNR